MSWRGTARHMSAVLLLTAICTLPWCQVALAAPLDLVGFADPGTAGLNTMVVGLDGFAYLGSWGSAAHCLGLGARVFDVRDPSLPTMVGTAAAYAGTTAEHLAAVHVATSAFEGNVLFVGIQRCGSSNGAASGLAIWDINDPAHPTELAFVSLGRVVRGVHEFSVSQKDGRWYAYLAAPNSELVSGQGDLRIVDVTDPRQPVQVADWGARKDAGLPIGSGSRCAPACRGAVPESYLHSVAVSADGRTAYLSYWDLGLLMLDVSESGAPRFTGQFAEPWTEEGNTHSVALAQDGKLGLVADETFAPPWGRLRLVDLHDPTNPFQIGTFDTPDSAAGTAGEQYAHSIHNPLVDDRDPNRAYLAWYSDGVRMLDISDGSRPIEIGSWIPPNNGMIWNVSLMGDLLLAGDINNGLFILRRS